MKISYVDFAVHGEPSVIYAEAAHCAQDQGQFWAYHDLLFENLSASVYSRKQLDGFAKKLNLNMLAFGQCLDTQKYRSFVVASTQQGRRMGIRMAPTLFVNQRIIMGFLPFKEVQPIIEEELSRAP